MTIYEKAKSLVTAREAAEHYGLTNRHGMALYPFHDDHNPSMKLDDRFHCFGCGEDGDVIATASVVAPFFIHSFIRLLHSKLGVLALYVRPVARQRLFQPALPLDRAVNQSG